RGGERAANLQSPPWPAGSVNLTPRGDDDVLDDREPEPGTARRARTVASVEALEEAGKLLLLETAPVVGRLEDARPRAKRQRRSRPGVANRVLGEVLGPDLEHATPKGQPDRRIGIE